jgi:transglutaminase-like putative cysteine protease
LRERAMKKPDLSDLGPASYIFASPIAQPEPTIARWAGSFLDEAMPVMAAGRALMGAIHQEFAYDADATETDTPPLEAFAKRHGVCQDFSHVMIIAARAHGIPAAYVSGYLRTLPPPGKERLIGADAMHAWVNLWCGEELGWIGFDPTNNVFAMTDHIFVAMGRDYSDVAPLDGVFRGGGQQTMFFSVDVAPVG